MLILIFLPKNLVKKRTLAFFPEAFGSCTDRRRKTQLDVKLKKKNLKPKNSGMSDHEDMVEPEAEEEPRPAEVGSEEAQQEVGEVVENEEEEELERELGGVEATDDHEAVVEETEEFESRSSATPTQDDTASPVEGQLPQPRLTDGLVSTLAVVLNDVPISTVSAASGDAQQPVGGSLLEVDAVSDGDLDDDGGGATERRSEVSFDQEL
jgi:hypothetical protein